MRIRRYGARALLVELDGPGTAGELAAWLRSRRLADEVVPGARTVLLSGVRGGAYGGADGAVDGDRSDLTDAAVAGVERVLAGWVPGEARARGPLVELPVRYDGPDLDDVARRWGMTRREAVATHAAVEHVVAFCGFAPGFPYLAGLPEELAVPRLESPRSRVAAGAVGIADTWTGVYPTGSPGGWRLLGHTEASLWEPEREPPALLPPGTRVRIVVQS